MPEQPLTSAHLWDDNPSETDLLGFDAVVAPIVEAARSSHLDPLTIGIHARWGGGKSTILNLISTQLEVDSSVVLLRTSPWEYDDHDDVKGTLIAEVLDGLLQRFKDDASLKTKVGELLGRISWSRVGKVLAKGAITHGLKLPELVEALKPKPRESPDSMAGFKTEFAKLVKDLPEVNKVVVLVDDLDRCMPGAVTATLEGIKLFLSVPGMVFVIAADQDMVRDAIAMNLGGSPESSRFAQRYLDKIVQLPVSLPVLPAHEAEGFIGLLLSRPGLDDAAFDALVEHARERRTGNKVPLLSEMTALAASPDEATLRLAGQLVQGLRSDKVVNPREIKRFLNAFYVRQQVAQARGLVVRPDVLAKLLLLEDRFRLDFEKLVNTPELERADLLTAWETWAKGDADTKPEGVSEESREWAAAEPDLAEQSIGAYLTLAASLAIIRQAGVAIDADLAGLIHDLSGETETLRRTALAALVERSEDDQRIAVESLVARGQRDGGPALLSLIHLADASPGVINDVVLGLRERCWSQIDAAVAVDLASATAAPLKGLARQLAEDSTVDPATAQAAKNLLDGELS